MNAVVRVHASKEVSALSAMSSLRAPVGCVGETRGGKKARKGGTKVRRKVLWQSP
jgi:hypothetical protein